MKRLNWLLVIPVIFGLTLFTSCEDDTLTEDEITITAGNVPDTVEVGVATNITFSIIADAKIASIELLMNNNTLDLKEDDFTNTTSDNYSYTLTATEAQAGEDLDFRLTVVDKDDAEEYVDFTIHVKELAATISEYTAVIMGANENDDYGSFLGTSNGTVYTVSLAYENQGAVDIIYYYGSENKATLAAPDDAGAAEFSVYNLSNWSTKNETRFTSTLSTDFSAVESSDDIDGLVSSPSATSAKDLSVDDVVGFVTDAGKKGVAKVTAITTGTTGTITIEVKVQL